MKKRFRRIELTKEGKMITAGAVAAIVLLALLAFFFLFRVDKVYVVGNTRYTDEEVKKYVMTTPLTSNTVLAMLFERHKNAENIPFVDSFDLERVNAHTIRIHVNEKKIVGYITQGTERLYFNKDGLVVEVTAMEQDEIDSMDQEEEELNQLKEQAAQEAAAKEADAALEALTGESADTTDRADTEDAQTEDGIESDTQQADSTEGQVLQAVESDTGNENATKFKAAVTDVPRVIGITDKEKGIALGDTIPAIADGIYNTILGITRMVEKYEILPEMVCFDENQEIILVYNNGNIHCNLGKDTLLEEKITRVAAILPKLSDFTGILHLEDYETDITNIIFSKETLYTLKMEIAQIEGRDFGEDTEDPAVDTQTEDGSQDPAGEGEGSTDSATDESDTQGDTVTDPDSDASGEDTETQDDSTQDNGSGDGSDSSTTEEDGGMTDTGAGTAQNGTDTSETQKTAGE